MIHFETFNPIPWLLPRIWVFSLHGKEDDILLKHQFRVFSEGLILIALEDGVSI